VVTVTEPAPPTQVAVSFTVSAADLAVANRLGERGTVPLLLLAAAAPILVGLLAWAPSPIAGAIFVALGVASFAVTRLPAFQRFWLARQAGSVLDEHRDMTVDGQGIHERFNSIDRLTPWAAFNELRITPDGAFFLSGGRLRLALPRRAFASADDLAGLIALVSAHASNIRIR
jgi:hypothetical protein